MTKIFRKGYETGVLRASARLAAKHEANKLIPARLLLTRQQHRAYLRQVTKGTGRTDRDTGVFIYVSNLSSTVAP